LQFAGAHKKEVVSISVDNSPNHNERLVIDELPIAEALRMYDLLPDILFWVKDSAGRVVHANKSFLDHIGVDSLDQAIGLTDFDFAPKHIAKQFIADDQRVIQGELVTSRLEMNVTGSGEISWFNTSKRPLVNGRGVIVGSYGTSHHLEKSSVALNAMEALKVPVAYVRENYMNKISLSELAEVSCLSISALERRFKKFLNKTPKQYICDVRLENARRFLVETTLPIALIADQCGFPDASYFSRKFYRAFSQRPSEFRASYQ
jgi:AraC-like DNA-binding protein